MTMKLFNLSVTLFVFVSLISGQEPQADSQCNTDFARSLVDQQVAESRSVTETDKRIQILIRSADFVWKADEPGARLYFSEAFKVASDRYAELGFERKESKGLLIQSPDHRFEVVRSIAKRDPAWARRLIDQLLKEYEKEAADRKDLDEDRELQSIMQIAQASVKTNPELSMYLFRRAMRYPADFHWLWALYGVAAEDPQFADRLYSELVRNYRTERPRRMLFFSAYPFARQRIFGVDKYSYGGLVPAGLQPNAALQLEFITTFLNRISSFAADPASGEIPGESSFASEPVYMVSALRELEPEIIQSFPTLLQSYSEARSQAYAMLNDEMRKTLDSRDKIAESMGRTFEQRIEEVEKADSEGKLTDSMIVSLITWGNDQITEKQFSLIEPWLDKVKDEKLRTETISYFWFLRSKRAIRDNRLAEANRFAAKVPELEHRAILLFEIAEVQLKDLNETAALYQTLADVRKVAASGPESVAKAKVLLGLATMYEKFNHTFALAELSDAVRSVNRLKDADILSKSIFRQIQGKDFAFYASYQMPGYDLESTFKLLSKNDFDMTLSNARALDDKYLRTLAVIAIAQNCIDRPKPKPRAVDPK